MSLAPPGDRFPPLPAWAIVALTAVYLVSGIGHDPWRNEDALHLGVAHAMAAEGRWLFPHIAGEPWPHTPPLYHWIAALSGRLLAPLLPFHDAARLATALFGALFLFALTRAANALHGQSAARSAPLLALGTLGLLVPLHEAQPAVAGMACATFAWWGGSLFLGNAPPARWRGALLIGTGSGLAFLCYGLVGLLMAAAALPAPALRRDWPALAIALVIAGLLILAWPLALLAQTPELWQAWWRNELAELSNARRWPGAVHAELLAWGYWPILPLALWSLWIERKQASRFLLPLLGVIIGIAWFLFGTTRLASLLPAMPPMLLIASAGAERLRRGAANAWSWFALTSFSFFGALVWLGASAQALDWPAKIAANFAKIAPGHEVDYGPILLLWATGLSLLWIGAWRLPRAPWRATLQWASGVTLLWALTSALWLSWLDHARSYRRVATEIRAALPASYRCIERNGLSASHRAVLDYHAGIRTHPASIAASCEWRVSVGRPGEPAGAGWDRIWSGQRPGDRRERWHLERRAG